MKTLHFVVTLAVFAASQLRAADTGAAATAINALGIDLLAKTGKPDENALLSPYSIQNALAMAYAGAAGKTHEEMAKALHFPKDEAELNASFFVLRNQLKVMEPALLAVANRLYGQTRYDFRKSFLAVLKESYGAPLVELDFKKSPSGATQRINEWVAGRTHQRIRDLIPGGALGGDTRLVLVNAIYFKAPWSVEFEKESTKPAPFHVNGAGGQGVPTMNHQADYGYARRYGYTAVSLPYTGTDLQFLILLPDRAGGLPELESKLTPALLSGCAKLKPAEVNLWLPKFKLELPSMQLSGQLKALGMRTAFDDPQGSADFDGIAPRKPDDYIYISEVFHKTFFSLDEHGTEAAAATAVEGKNVMGEVPEKPVKVHEVHVDHPFIFAIQDCKSGTCLFIGRVTDPR